MSPSLQIFAINLDRSKDRWQTISDTFGGDPWPLIRVPAYDSLADTEEILTIRGQEIVDPPDGIGWNPLRLRMFSLVEEATFCSHLRALRMFLQSDAGFGLILEDDAERDDDFVDVVHSVLDSGLAFDVLKLEGCRDGAHLAIIQRQLGGRTVVRSLRPSSGAAAYIVSRKGAEEIIARAGGLRIPFDDYLANPGIHDLLIYHLSPYPVRQAGGESTMGRLRLAVRHKKRRDPASYVLQVSRRVWLRGALWRSAFFRPTFSPLAIRKVPW